VTAFEKAPLFQLVTENSSEKYLNESPNQLNLFEL